jgi:type III secretory pathway component EscS
MKLLIIAIVLFAVAGWLGVRAAHWADQNIKPRTVIEEIAQP